MSAPDVIVIGGGIIGLSIARSLARRGADVEVLERGRPGHESSWAAAGMLAPLAEVPEPGPFFDACRASRDAWHHWAPDLEEETGIDLDYDRSGSLFVDPRPAMIRRFETAAKSLGEPCMRVDPEALHTLVPDLDPAIRSALLLTGEHRIDNRAVCRALVRGLERRRVPVLGGCRVESIRTRRLEVEVAGPGFERAAARVVIAAGSWSGRFAGAPWLPVRPVRGQMLALEGISWPFIGSVRTADAYAVRRGRGVVIGATVEEAGYDASTTEAGREVLVGITRRLFPGLATSPPVSYWSGLRPGTPDDRPLIGPLERDRLWVATGHYRNGILLAPWTAETLADAITGDPSSRDALAPFLPGRFVTASAFDTAAVRA